MRTAPLIAAALLLSSCTGERQLDDPVVDEADAAVEPIRPSLAGSEYDPLVTLRGLDPQWTEAPFDTGSNYNASLGLDRSYFAWSDTNLTYDRTDEGGLYLITLRSGMPGRCESGPDLMLAFNQFAEDFALGAQADQFKPRLMSAWASEDDSVEAEMGKVLVRAIGGCPRTLLLKAL